MTPESCYIIVVTEKFSRPIGDIQMIDRRHTKLGPRAGERSRRGMNAVSKDGHSNSGSHGGNQANKNIKTVTYRLEDKHIEMLQAIAESYRIPNNISHAVRLMIEDKFNEIVATKTDGKE